MRICAVFGCSSSTYQLQKWRTGFCAVHNCHRTNQDCTCAGACFSKDPVNIGPNNLPGRRQGLFQTFCGWTTYRRSSMPCCPYGVQRPTEKTSGKSSPQNEKSELNWTELNFIDNNIYIITKLLAPATSKMTNRGGGKGYTLTTREK